MYMYNMYASYNNYAGRFMFHYTCKSPPIRGHGFSVEAKCGDLADLVKNSKQSGQYI